MLGRRVVVGQPAQLGPAGAAVQRAGEEGRVGVGGLAGPGQPVGHQRAVAALRHRRQIGPVGEETLALDHRDRRRPVAIGEP